MTELTLLRTKPTAPSTPTQPSASTRAYWDDGGHHPPSATSFGFWLYLMSDCLIFAVLFAAYAVLGRNYAGGPSGSQLFDLRLVATNTAILLFSSITFGFAMLGMQSGRVRTLIGWLAVTGVLGLGFLSLELREFWHLLHEGEGPDRSAFLSSFFVLVGTHGLHVFFGCVWMATLMVQVAGFGITAANQRRLMCLSMFWHFLDVVWVGVFTFVYLIGSQQ